MLAVGGRGRVGVDLENVANHVGLEDLQFTTTTPLEQRCIQQHTTIPFADACNNLTWNVITCHIHRTRENCVL